MQVWEELNDEHNEELQKIGQRLNEQHGSTFSKKDLKVAIMEACHQEDAKQGLVDCQEKPPCDNTLTIYMARLVSLEQVSLTSATIKKTPAQWTAQHSLISALDYVVAVAAMYWEPCKEWDEEERA